MPRAPSSTNPEARRGKSRPERQDAIVPSGVPGIEAGDGGEEPVPELGDVTGTAEASFAFNADVHNYLGIPIHLREINGALEGSEPAELSRVGREIGVVNKILSGFSDWRLSGRFVILANEIRFELVNRGRNKDRSRNFDHTALAKVMGAVESRGEIKRQLRLPPDHRDQDDLERLQDAADQCGLPMETLDKTVGLLANGDALTIGLPHGDGTQFRPPQVPRKEDLRPATTEVVQQGFEDTVLCVIPDHRLLELAGGELARLPRGQDPTAFGPGDVVRILAGPPVKWTRRVYEPADAIEIVQKDIFAQ